MGKREKGTTLREGLENLNSTIGQLNDINLGQDKKPELTMNLLALLTKADIRRVVLEDLDLLNKAKKGLEGSGYAFNVEKRRFIKG